MGTITILPETTKNPITLMGQRAGVCWGGNVEDPEKNYLEEIQVQEQREWDFEYVHQKTGEQRWFHNIAMCSEVNGKKKYILVMSDRTSDKKMNQARTRYINYAGRGFDYIIPPSIQNNKEALEKYQALMAHINEECRALQEDYGIPKEDVANGLPLGMTASIVDKRNLRSLTEMSHQRMCNRAYWEYRQLFGDIRKALSEYSEEWRWIADNLFMPKCDYFGYCSETRPCGKPVSGVPKMPRP